MSINFIQYDNFGKKLADLECEGWSQFMIFLGCNNFIYSECYDFIKRDTANAPKYNASKIRLCCWEQTGLNKKRIIRSLSFGIKGV